VANQLEQSRLRSAPAGEPTDQFGTRTKEDDHRPIAVRPILESAIDSKATRSGG
jgi:hypothetical protein